MDPTPLEPDLIIRLGHDALGLAMPARPGGSWQSDYRVKGWFRPTEIASVLDKAFADNPDLFTANRVEVLVTHFPHALLPAYLQDEAALDALVRKYIRVRKGDEIQVESVSAQGRMGYALPQRVLDILREYFAKARPVHLAAVLWQAVNTRQPGVTSEAGDGRLWINVNGQLMTALFRAQGRLAFSKVFTATAESDIIYYCSALHRLLKPMHTTWVTMDGQASEPVPAALRPLGTDRLHLPGMSTLIEEYRACGS
jgi:hypothetical protein